MFPPKSPPPPHRRITFVAITLTINAVIIAINIGIIIGKTELASLASGACIFIFCFQKAKAPPRWCNFSIESLLDTSDPIFFF